MGGFFCEKYFNSFYGIMLFMHPTYKQWYGEKVDNIGYHIVNMNPTFTKNNSIF
jgi:hypothetical protein